MLHLVDYILIFYNTCTSSGLIPASCCTYLLLQFIFVFTFVDYTPSTYGKYQYPGWADAIGWILACVVIAPIFIGMGYRLYEEEDYHSPIEVRESDDKVD